MKPVLTHQKKIGLYLAAEPSGGGTFQYGISILEAFHALPTDPYEKIVIYKQPEWLTHLQGYDGVRAIAAPSSFLGKALARIWRDLRLPMSLWRMLSPLLHATTRLMISEKCDLWIFPSQDHEAYENPIRSLVSIHDLMHRYHPDFPEVGNKKEFKWREYHYKNTCLYAAGILVDSDVGRQHVLECYPKEIALNSKNVFKLPFVPPKYVFEKPNPDHLAAFENKYHLPRKFFFYPAQFWAHKNHAGLIRAAALLKKQGIEIDLVFAGSKKNAYEPALKLCQELGLSEHVHFLGYVPDPDICEILRRARALIMPSFFGPTNIPPLEAMALGCPIAVADVYAMPSQLPAFAREAGVIFDPHLPESISKTLKKLWEDDLLCDALKKEGLIHSKKWQQPQFNDRLREIIRKILE